METTKINIGLRFDEEIIDEIVATLDEFRGEFEARYIVDNEEFIPHITIYQNAFPTKNLKEISQLLKDISGNAISFKLKFRRLTHFKTSIWAEFDKAPELMSLHQNIIEQIQPLRGDLLEAHFTPGHPVYESLTVTRKKMIEKYGHPYVGEMYEPHSSLMKLVDRELVYPVLNRIDWRIREIPIRKIAIYESGEDGTCKSVLEEFSLNS